MVQRKLQLPPKLTLLHAKPQSLSHHHDLKSPRGADLKAKKMKKSASIKRPPLKPKPPPNYMKSTTSSDARKEQSQSKSSLKVISSSSSGKKATKRVAARTLTKNPSFKPAIRAKCSPVVNVLCESVDSQRARATCSSTLKNSKFPDFLSLTSEGTSAMKVCPYTYCSLNGHHHHPPLPPLKSFLSARRRAIKTQARRPPPVGHDHFNSCSIISPLTQQEEEEEKNDFFLEIYTAGIDQTASEDQEERVCDDFGQNQEVLMIPEGKNEEFFSESAAEQDHSDGSDMEWEIGCSSPLQFDYDYEYEHQHSTDHGADVVDIKVSSDGKDCCFDEYFINEVSAPQESCDEEGFSSNAFSSSDDGDDLQILSTINIPPTTDSQTGNQVSFDDLNPNEDAAAAVIGEESAEAEGGIFSKAQGENGAEREREEISLLRFTANSKKVVEDGDELGGFNPRAPNFLQLEAEPEAEKVDLRHQDLDERRSSDEWMVDYALRQVVTKLGPVRKRKVALLVEAFEKVMPTTKFDLHLRHGSPFDQPRQIQACS